VDDDEWVNDFLLIPINEDDSEEEADLDLEEMLKDVDNNLTPNLNLNDGNNQNDQKENEVNENENDKTENE